MRWVERQAVSELVKESRGWVYTCNNYTEEMKEKHRERAEMCKYAIIGYEGDSEDKTEHMQGYYLHNSPVKGRTLKKLCGNCHWASARAEASFSKIYCAKEGNHEEWGVCPKSSKQKGEANFQRWQDAYLAAKEGRLDDVPPDLRIKYYNAFNNIRKDNMVKPKDLEVTCGSWYWGVSGAGKSHRARVDFPDAYLKMANKWWDGYQDEPDVILEDIDPSHTFLLRYIKVWADKYAYMAEIKTTARMMRPARICVTSNYHPSQIFDVNDPSWPAIRRRFRIIKFSCPYRNGIADEGVEEEMPDIEDWVDLTVFKYNVSTYVYCYVSVLYQSPWNLANLFK